ncbi:haloacid dehalogenase [Schizopora paradoxa]|uniref:Haloacid dehalogenase n=1 Tax=Schizopora paradoxa TaxID=27342 RepID=A0A0H2S995_9AGAM|nr:haloacid dehalogenase [Schizopora paradoxa]
MSTSSKYVLAFDIYGTLLDTSKVGGDLASTFALEEERAADISALWRRYQLEYTWRLNSMNKYEPFDVVTKKALTHALSESGIKFLEEDVEKLMISYNSLQWCEMFCGRRQHELTIHHASKSSFPDVVEMLQDLKALKEIDVVVFSNAVQKYKPAPEVYHGLVEAVGKAGNAQDVFLVSGNPFDVTGALASGFRAIWVDRGKKGWIDQLGGQAPTVIVHGLDQLKQYVEKTLLW